VTESPVRPRLIAFDADGTLVDHSRRISPRVKAAIAAAQARGVHQAICTGRPLVASLGYIRDLGLRGPQITFDGALIKDVDTGEVVTRRTADSSALGVVLAFARRHDLLFELYLEDAYYSEHDNAASAVHAELIGVWPRIANLDDVLAMSNVMKGHFIFSDPGQVALTRRLAESMRDVLRFSFATPPPGFGALEFANVVAPGVTKGEALRRLAAYYGISIAETIGVGDGQNDLPLIEAAGIGVAMGNSPADVIAAADEITASVDEDGLALVIEQHALA
jgi:5-amino-6-(5-phospho-D-ribitylamino)uracil phosphatase